MGQITAHGLVVGVAGVLGVHHSGHAFHRGVHLLGAQQAVVQPVGDVLGRDPQRCPVLHERHIVDVGNLRAADALAHPAGHVAKDALRVVLQLSGHLGGGQLSSRLEGGDLQHVERRCRRALGQLALPGRHVGLQVVQRVQRCGHR